ncbi:MAG: CHAP domain-containing protein [Lachnospiraceae bacterium]|nr:CHAP domain-containing protein [Lachnospiraceae bacterium]
MSKKLSKVLKVTLSIVLSVILMVSSVTPAFAISYNGSESYKSGKYYTALTKVKLTGNKRTDIVNIAKSQVGYKEGNNSSQLSGTVKGKNDYTEYGRWYGMQDMWCAMFVSWCANVAGVKNSVIPKHAKTTTGLQTFKNWGRAYSRSDVAAGKYKPMAGDIIYFKTSRNNAITNHVGIVTKYSGSTIYTIEGNSSDKVSEKSYSIGDTKIVYICSPNYDGTPVPTPTPAASFPMLKNGSKGYRVKALQYMLNYHVKAGLSVDGIFGPATKKAVIKFQKSKSLSQDGIVGEKTWTKLTSVNQSKSSNKPNLTRAIQVLLNNKISAKLTVNGKFNESTKNAVIKFQKSKKIKADGVVNAKTWKYLLS